MMYSEGKQQQWGGAQQQDAATTTRPPTGEQVLPPPLDPAEHIKVGTFYEIDHSKLSHKFPDQLTPIRLVMVNEKTRMRVSLRYPSIYSLRSYFNENSYDLNTIANYSCTNNYKPPVDAKKLPALDEKYTIGSEVAADALYRRIPPDELSERRHSWRFWATVPVFSSTPREGGGIVSPAARHGVVWRKGTPPTCGSLVSELKCPGMIRWGKRRVVQFLARHAEEERKSEEAASGESEEGEGDEERERQEEERESDEEEKVVEKSGALKRGGTMGHREIIRTSPRLQKRKSSKLEGGNKVVVQNNSQKKRRKNRAAKSCIDRWSTERYKLAEVNMLKVMKEKGALIGNPILRPALRNAARKLIGDTGLLDHLLKHMAEKVAPGGEERFRRRHNAEGAMEYWLEKADLVDIRKEAGIQDPYWIPPPGWKPGDNPFQDRVVAGEIKEIKKDFAQLHKEIKETKEEIAQLKKDVEVLASKKHEEYLAILATPISSVSSQTMERNGILIPMKETYIDLVNKRAKLEGQLTEISYSLSAVQEEMGRSKSEKPALFASSQERTPTSGTEVEGIHGMQQKTGQPNPGGWIQEGHDKAELETQSAAGSQAIQDDKASKIERLKSGFRICKPQGTFLWPDKALSSPQYVVSPSSVTSHAQNKYNNQSISSAATTTATSTTTRTTLINLNDPPEYQNDNLVFESHSHVRNSSFPLTYQRRQQHFLPSPAVVPCFPAAEKEMRSNGGGMERGCFSSAPAGSSSCLSRGAASWLALATTKQSEDNKSKRG